MRAMFSFCRCRARFQHKGAHHFADILSRVAFCRCRCRDTGAQLFRLSSRGSGACARHDFRRDAVIHISLLLLLQIWRCCRVYVRPDVAAGAHDLPFADVDGFFARRRCLCSSPRHLPRRLLLHRSRSPSPPSRFLPDFAISVFSSCVLPRFTIACLTFSLFLPPLFLFMIARRSSLFAAHFTITIFTFFVAAIMMRAPAFFAIHAGRRRWQPPLALTMMTMRAAAPPAPRPAHDGAQRFSS